MTHEQARYVGVVNVYHDLGHDCWVKAKAALIDELGQDKVFELGEWYDTYYSSEAESCDARRHEAQYR